MLLQGVILNGEKVNIEVQNGKITAITTAKTPVIGDELIAVAGMVDVHLHGFAGYDTMDADFAPLCAELAKRGTTSFLPTTMTASVEELARVTAADTQCAGAEILGFHLEGPFISKEKKGAQNEAYIIPASLDAFAKWHNIKKITVAPETEGCLDFIKAVSSSVSVSIGHTACDYDTACEAIDNGANCLTHTFNAMPQFINRASGPIGAAFEKGAYAEVICDGKHVSKSHVLALYAMFGADRLVLISDTICSAGLPDGVYESGGLDVILQDGVATNRGGNLAGGSHSLWDGVRMAVSFGIPFDDAVKMATRTPATMIGATGKGDIEIGLDADILLVDKHLQLQKVYIAGKEV